MAQNKAASPRTLSVLQDTNNITDNNKGGGDVECDLMFVPRDCCGYGLLSWENTNLPVERNGNDDEESERNQLEYQSTDDDVRSVGSTSRLSASLNTTT